MANNKDKQIVLKEEKKGAMEDGAIIKATNNDDDDSIPMTPEMLAQLGLLDDEDDLPQEVPIELSLEGIYEDKENAETPIITFDKAKFQQGANNASELCGYYCALRMAGASEQFILSILSNKDDLVSIDKQCKAQVDIAKETANANAKAQRML